MTVSENIWFDFKPDKKVFYDFETTAWEVIEETQDLDLEKSEL